MAKDKHGVHIPKMESPMSIGRKRLSDITNTGVPRAPSLMNARELAVKTPLTLTKGNASQFLKEIGLLKKLLAEKESTIESQSLEMKKLWINNCRASQRNRQLIKTNSEISKELANEREKLMLLQHDYKQMYAMFKAKIADLEEKANDMSEQLQDMQERKGKISGKNIGEQESQSKYIFSRDNTDSSPCKSGTSICIPSVNHIVGRISKANDASGFLKLDEPSSEENSSDKRTSLRRRSTKISYKEPTLKKKLRQHNQCEFPLTDNACQRSCYATSSNGIDNLQKVCEQSEDEVLEIMDMPQSDTMIQDIPTSGESQDPSTSTESCQSLENSFFSSMRISDFRGKATRVKLEPSELEEQEGHLPSSLCLAADLETTQPSRKSFTGRPMRKAAEIVVSYKETPINIKLRRPA